jgi:Ca2+-binding RTX toxin-like protein
MPLRAALLALLLAQACDSGQPAPPESATAERVVATDTCYGQTATIIAEYDGFQTVGTSGPDVIISSGAGDIDSDDGKDLVCVIGNPRSDSDFYGRYVDTGDGNDRVDTRGTRLTIAATLAAGADQYDGGPGGDSVHADGSFDDDFRDTDADIIWIGSRADTVTTSGGSDIVVREDGNDYLNLIGTLNSDAVLNGGSGSNVLNMTIASEVQHSWSVDHQAERLPADGTLKATWDKFSQFEIYAHGPVKFIGSRLDESLTVKLEATLGGARLGGRKLPRSPIDARMRAGDDLVSFRGGPIITRLNGGSGRDKIRYDPFHRHGKNAASAVALDLATGWLTDREKNWRRRWQVRHFEDANVSNQTSLTQFQGRTYIRGTNEANLLSVKLVLADTTIHGASGDDVLVGGGGNDLLQGGRGLDSANGRPGLDRCEAEVVTLCERGALRRAIRRGPGPHREGVRDGSTH